MILKISWGQWGPAPWIRWWACNRSWRSYLDLGAGGLRREHLVAAVLAVSITNAQGADELVARVAEYTRHLVVVILKSVTPITNCCFKSWAGQWHNAVCCREREREREISLTQRERE